MNDGTTGGGPPSVLLVDDTADLRALVRMALERRGDFRVVAEAGDGREGVDSAKAHQPDVVLLDIAMPVMSGLEALPLIREVCPTSTVIMLSGFGADKMAAQALQAGADGYIQKGQPIRALLAQVHSLVETARSRGTLDQSLDGGRRGDRRRRRSPITWRRPGSTAPTALRPSGRGAGRGGGTDPLARHGWPDQSRHHATLRAATSRGTPAALR